MKNFFLIFIFLSSPSFAAFHDEGFTQAKVRSDYNSSNVSYGTCLFNHPSITSTYSCSGPTSWSNSNFYSENGGSSSSTYWVLSANNENAFSLANSGPPNQSLPITSPGSGGIFGFITYKECEHCNETSNPSQCAQSCENYYRAHLVLNNQDTNPLGSGGIPFLGINAASNRGNSQFIARVKGGWFFERNSIMFNAKLYDYNASNDKSFVNFYVYLTASWPDPITGSSINRMLFINLAHTPNYNLIPNTTIFPKYPSDTETNNIPDIPINAAGLNLSWNWPVVQSFYYPGADFAWMEAEDMNTYCPGVNINSFNLPYTGNNSHMSGSPIEKTFFINLTDVFQCASDRNLFDSPIPQSGVTLKIAGWANEIATQNGADRTKTSIWTAVSNMRTYRSTPQYTSTSNKYFLNQTQKYLYPVLSNLNNLELLELESKLNSSITKSELIKKYNISIEDKIDEKIIDTDMYQNIKREFGEK